MRPLFSIAALTLALAVATVAIVPPATADAGKPTWSTGDFWVYSYTGSFGSVFPWIAGPGTYRLEVIGIDTVSLGTASYEAYRLRLTLNGSNVIQYHGGDSWYRTSDFSLVKTTYNVTATIIIELTFIITITYDPPLAVRWPLKTQDTWTSSSTRTTVSPLPPGPMLLDSTFVVEATSTVTVPAGSFETTPLRDQSGERSTTYWAPSTGNYARKQTFDSNDQETSSAELTSFRYSPEFLGLPILAWIALSLFVIIIISILILRRPRRR